MVPDAHQGIPTTLADAGYGGTGWDVHQICIAVCCEEPAWDGSVFLLVGFDLGPGLIH